VSRYAIVTSRYYAELAERLERGAQAGFADAGVEDVDVF
jgi:6,7-dimethyl-8-ribityllumazine synthase